MWPSKHIVENITQPRSNTGGERRGCLVARRSPPETQPRPPREKSRVPEDWLWYLIP